MSKILELEIKSCSECPFQSSELIASDERGVLFSTKPFCKKDRKIQLIQSELIRGKISRECPLANKITVPSHHSSDAIEYFLSQRELTQKKSSFKEKMDEAKLIQEIENSSDFISEQELEVRMIGEILDKNPYHQDLLKVSNKVLDEILERNITVKTINSLKILLNRPM